MNDGKGRKKSGGSNQRRRRGRSGGGGGGRDQHQSAPRGPVMTPLGQSTYEAVFDHGNEGYGVWFDGVVREDPMYRQHWKGHRPIFIKIDEESIVIGRKLRDVNPSLDPDDDTSNDSYDNGAGDIPEGANPTATGSSLFAEGELLAGVSRADVNGDGADDGDDDAQSSSDAPAPAASSDDDEPADEAPAPKRRTTRRRKVEDEPSEAGDDS